MIDARMAVSAGIGGLVAAGIAVVAFLSLGGNDSGPAPTPATPFVVRDATPATLSPEAGETEAPADDAAAAVSGFEQSEIGNAIRSYLKKHPEVVIEAINSYNARQAAAHDDRLASALSDNLKTLLDPATSFVAGKNPAKAKVAIVEMYDYHCAFCKKASATVRKLASEDEAVKVVFRELPVLRKESEYAAKMALASRAQGKFINLHFAMMNASGVLTKERVDDIARDNGVDVGAAGAAINGRATASALQTNHALANALGIDGTPAFVVATTNGNYVAVVSGFDPQELLEAIQTAKKNG